MLIVMPLDAVQVVEAKRNEGQDINLEKCPVCLQRDKTHAMTPCGHRYCQQVGLTKGSFRLILGCLVKLFLVVLY